MLARAVLLEIHSHSAWSRGLSPEWARQRHRRRSIARESMSAICMSEQNERSSPRPGAQQQREWQ